jgi:predicted RNA-binding protein with PUA-like domain
MAYWLLQCNESHWRIRDFFTDGRTGTVWHIRQHWKRMSPGDGVAVWLSGKDGGVAAVGQVAGEPYQGTPEAADEQYWAVDHRVKGERWLVPVEFSAHFPGHPIRRDVLEADPRFAHALILRMAGGRNPYPLEEGEWAAITERVPPPGPHVVATAVRGAAVAVAVGATAVREAGRSVVG